MENEDKVKELQEEVEDLKIDITAQKEFTRLYAAVNKTENRAVLNCAKIQILEDEIKGVKVDITDIKTGMKEATTDRMEIKKTMMATDTKVSTVLLTMENFIVKYKNDLWKFLVGIFIMLFTFFGGIWVTQDRSIKTFKDDIIKLLIEDKVGGNIKERKKVYEYEKK